MTDVGSSGDPAIAVVVCEAEIERSIESAWLTIGSFADAGRFLNISSKLISGHGDLGSVRLIGGSILEALIAVGPYCYGYAQIRGPMAPFMYHGFVSLQHLDPDRCKLIYTLLYDQSGMDDDRRVSETDRIRTRFSGAANAMKRDAEAPGT